MGTTDATPPHRPLEIVYVLQLGRERHFFSKRYDMLVLLLIFAGIILVMANELVAARQHHRVVYKYLPRDLDTYLREEPRVSHTFKNMFDDDTVY